MTDKDKTSDNSGSGKKTLTLKGAPNLGARPGMSRSSRTVVVEKRTRRVGGPGTGAPQQSGGNASGGGGRPQSGQRPGGRPQSASPRQNANSASLTQNENQARERALREAAARAEEDRAKAEEEAQRHAEIDARRKAEREEAERRAAAVEAEKAREAANEELDGIVPVKAGQARPKPVAKPSPRAAQPDMPPPPPPGEGEDDRVRRRAAPGPKALVDKDELERAKRNAAPRPSATPARRDSNSRGRLNVNSALDDSDRRGPSLAAMRRRQNKKMGRNTKVVQPKLAREVTIPEAITVAELANRMAERAVDVIKLLMAQDQMVKINDIIDADTAELIATEMGHTVKRVAESDVEGGLFDDIGNDEAGDLVNRPPVVTIMGHVDHGKTSLLDAIREANVVSTEAGGITQHIGAYHVRTDKGVVTFLDTPGHAAFTRMRARGAQVTDVVILVVAADDGVMPQTREAIQHSKAAGVPMIVAITKVDKPDADLDSVKSALSKEEVFVEDWGGDVQCVGVSAHTGAGIDDLLDAILVQSELLELTAPVDAPARGQIIESSVEKGRGPVATVLVRSGTLNQGDVVLSGPHFGRVRAMFDEAGKPVKTAGPSIPVQILGLSGAPDAGDDVVAVANERKARELAELREVKLREQKLAQTQAVRMEQVFAQMGEGARKSLNLMIKADVQGSSGALQDSLLKIPSAEVKVNIVSAAVGGISESDVDLALASQAIIIGFNTRADSVARRRIQETGVDVRYYSIIYDVLDDVSDAIAGLLGTETREQIIGIAQVRDVFRSSKFGAVAGCLTIEGEVRRGLPIRVLRDSVVIYEGELESLRRHKDDVSKVEAGTECGIAVQNYNDVKVGDQIECFDRIEVKRTVSAQAAGGRA